MSMAIGYAMHKKKMAQGGDLHDLPMGKRYPNSKRKLSDQDIGELDELHQKRDAPGVANGSDEYRGHQDRIDDLLGNKKRPERRMAQGGEMPCAAHGAEMCKMCHGGKMMAEGGEVEEEEASGYQDFPTEEEKHEFPHAEENQEFPPEEEDMVGRIMRHRGYMAEGGEMRNETGEDADMEMNQFDDMVKEDPDFSKADYTGANSGDEIGNEHLDEDEEDLVARIMKQRRMKDRNPVPA